MTMTRRDAITTVAAGSALLVAAAHKNALGEKQPVKGPSSRPHEVVPLPFAAAKLAGISERMIVSHHDNNYAAAVKNLNKVEAELAQVGKDTPGYVVYGLRERELVYTNSVILHEHYFANLGGDGKIAGGIGKALASGSGSLARWEELFRATAMSLGGGSGWVILAYNLHTRDLRTYASSGHSQALAYGRPLLVLDMYEHAYAMDYGAGHAAYIDAFFKNVKWDEVNRRFERARKAAKALASR
jgi:Fe-Mn family superoxide dismutase